VGLICYVYICGMIKNKILGGKGKRFMALLPPGHSNTYLGHRVLTSYTDYTNIKECCIVTWNSKDYITLNETETIMIKDLCEKYKIEEPECNLQTLCNIIIQDNPNLESILPNVTELARSSSKGDVIITAAMLLNKDKVGV